MSIIKEKKLLDEVRDVMRVNHYSIHTERSYCDWIKRYVRFHGMSSRNDLKDGEKKVEEFLTYLAVDKNVSPSTQNQAMNDSLTPKPRSEGKGYCKSLKIG